jgi:formylglycine-generating enzyme required for sulfatase activity
MVVVTGGTFKMGDSTDPASAPVRDVTVDTFFLDRMEVTNADFERFVQETGYVAEGEWKNYVGKDRERHPVVAVTWNDAAAFSKWAGKRLPTEAEWEFAARAGRPDAVYGVTGDGKRLENNAAFGRLAVYPKRMPLGGVQTSPVGFYDPNPLGLHDMSGNVAEWCADWYESPYPAPAGPAPIENPAGPEFGRGKVIRGGAWNDREEYQRITHRMGMPPGSIAFVFGFRCAADYPRPPKKTASKWWPF